MKNLKQSLLAAHHKLVLSGEYLAARKVLYLLIHGQLVLGLSDNDWAAEMALEEVGITGFSNKRGTLNHFYLKG